MRTDGLSIAGRRSGARLGLILLAIASLFTAGCTSVAFHEKGRLNDKLMSFDESGPEVHFYQKTYYSREGSVGGFGGTAGGGCGCY